MNIKLLSRERLLIASHTIDFEDVTRFNKIAIHVKPQMVVEKEYYILRQHTHTANN